MTKIRSERIAKASLNMSMSKPKYKNWFNTKYKVKNKTTLNKFKTKPRTYLNKSKTRSETSVKKREEIYNPDFLF